MLRPILWHLFLFSLPFLAYGLAVLFSRGNRTWADGPKMRLAAAGLGLVAASLIFIAITTGEDKDGTYVPAKYEDGKIVPGYIEPTPVE